VGGGERSGIKVRPGQLIIERLREFANARSESRYQRIELRRGFDAVISAASILIRNIPELS
jgi:hypothetical protein